MAEAPKPPKKSNTSKGNPPAEIESSANLNKANEGDLVALSFKVTKELKKDFRNEALEEEITMTEFLKKIFDHYKKTKHGSNNINP